MLIGATRCDDKCENTVFLETQGPCESERKCSTDTVTDDTSARVENVTIFMHVWSMNWICWVFALTWQRLHVSLGDQVAHAPWSLARTQDSSSPTQYVPLWSTQLEKAYKPEAGHVILSPFGSSSTVIPKFFNDRIPS